MHVFILFLIIFSYRLSQNIKWHFLCYAVCPCQASQVGLVVKNPPASAGDKGDWGLFSGGGHGNSPQCSCLENPMDRGAWWATDHRIARVGHFSSVQFSSFQSISCVWLFATPWTSAHQASLSITNSWSWPKSVSFESLMPSTISSSVVPFSHLQSFPASGSFQMSQLFTSGGQSIAVSASASVLPINIQDWFPLGWTGWISLQSKGLSRVFSNTTVQKHQFFSTQLSLYSNSHIHTWPLEKP